MYAKNNVSESNAIITVTTTKYLCRSEIICVGKVGEGSYYYYHHSSKIVNCYNDFSINE